MPIRSTLAAALAATAVFALPAVASADFTSAVAGDTVTLTGDADSDVLNLAVDADGNLTHNRGPAPGGSADAAFESATDFDPAAGVQTVAAAGKTVVVNAGAGDDAVTYATAAVVKAVVDGGAGDDVLTGANLADELRGAEGDDRLVGGRGNDDMEGGANNDTLVWNNGDGSDVMDGDAGNDAVEVNGAPTQGDVFTIKPNAARVRFDRTNLGAFNLDIGSTERMEVNGLGGDDGMTVDPGLGALLMTLSGGAGADTIAGGDSADLILGGEDADTLAGGGGDDRVVGDRGNDTMAGGAGDDTLVWNNGDGSDKIDGDDGLDTTEVNGAVAAGDAFTVVANAGRAKFDRTNIGPFTLDMATEALDVRGLGGDDTLTVADGAPVSVRADGGAGNDTLAGADGADSLSGGSGNDVLTGNAGRDVLDGQNGDDRLEARDGAEDLARCGAGADTAIADAGDAVDACESVERPAPAAAPPAAPRDTVAAALRVSTKPIRLVRSGRGYLARVRVSCPASEPTGCRSKVTLLAKAFITNGGGRVEVVVARTTVNLAGGQARTLRLRLPLRVAELARRGRITGSAESLTRDAAGNIAERSSRLTIIVP